MKTTRIRIISLILALALALTLFSACGEAIAPPSPTLTDAGAEGTLRRVPNPVETVAESPELETKLKVNCGKQSPIPVKVILTCGEKRDVPYLVIGSARTLNPSGHMDAADGYHAFGWRWEWVKREDASYPILEAALTDTLTLFVNDEEYPYVTMLDNGILQNGITLLSFTEDKEIGTFSDIASMSDLAKGKYYAYVSFTCYGDDIYGKTAFVERERATLRAYFILDLQ